MNAALAFVVFLAWVLTAILTAVVGAFVLYEAHRLWSGRRYHRRRMRDRPLVYAPDVRADDPGQWMDDGDLSWETFYEGLDRRLEEESRG